MTENEEQVMLFQPGVVAQLREYATQLESVYTRLKEEDPARAPEQILEELLNLRPDINGAAHPQAVRLFQQYSTGQGVDEQYLLQVIGSSIGLTALPLTRVRGKSRNTLRTIAHSLDKSLVGLIYGRDRPRWLDHIRLLEGDLRIRERIPQEEQQAFHRLCKRQEQSVYSARLTLGDAF